MLTYFRGQLVTGGRRRDSARAREALFADAAALEGFTERQRELLAAALAVFNRKGYEGSRTREIAEEAGVSEALLFKNFPTKRHLLAALMKPFLATVVKPAMMNPVVEILSRSADRPVEEVMREVLRERLSLLRSRLPLLRTLALEAMRQPDLLEIIQAEVVPVIAGFFGQMLDRAEARGEIHGVDRALFMRSALSLLVGYVVLSGMAPATFGAASDDAAVDGIVHLMFHGTGGSSAPGKEPPQ